MLQPSLQKNDKKAKALIYIVSFLVFAAVVLLSKIKLDFPKAISLINIILG